MGESTKPTSAEALRALQLQEVRWQAILDTARDAIIGIDPTGRVSTCPDFSVRSWPHGSKRPRRAASPWRSR
jgi:hypothetical protein